MAYFNDSNCLERLDRNSSCDIDEAWIAFVIDSDGNTIQFNIDFVKLNKSNFGILQFKIDEAI